MSFETTVSVRYSDLDTYGHVNNAVYATYLEEARVDYLEAALGGAEGEESAGQAASDGPSGAEDLLGETGETGVVIANLEVNFERPLRTHDAVTVTVTVPELGQSTIPMVYDLREPGADEPVATGETTMVAFDRAAGESCPLPDAWRDAIESFEGL